VEEGTGSSSSSTERTSRGSIRSEGTTRLRRRGTLLVEERGEGTAEAELDSALAAVSDDGHFLSFFFPTPFFLSYTPTRTHLACKPTLVPFPVLLRFRDLSRVEHERDEEAMGEREKRRDDRTETPLHSRRYASRNRAQAMCSEGKKSERGGREGAGDSLCHHARLDKQAASTRLPQSAVSSSTPSATSPTLSRPLIDSLSKLLLDWPSNRPLSFHTPPGHSVTELQHSRTHPSPSQRNLSSARLLLALLSPFISFRPPFNSTSSRSTRLR
jgi:hypothetical protein